MGVGARVVALVAGSTVAHDAAAVPAVDQLFAGPEEALIEQNNVVVGEENEVILVMYSGGYKLLVAAPIIAQVGRPQHSFRGEQLGQPLPL